MFAFQLTRVRPALVSAPLRILAVAACGLAAIGATPALAQSVELAAGQQALNRGDNVEAVRLLTRALGTPGIAPADQEHALALRAQASLATGDAADALNDARRASLMDPNDDLAAGVRQKAQIALIERRPAGEPDPSQAAAAVGLNSKQQAQSAKFAAENEANAKAYQAAVVNYHQNETQYQADRKAEKDAYAAAQADYQSKLKAAEAKRQADLAAWNACKKGDRSKCAPH
ncbi:MAG: hypothetical protein JO111_16925 [Caulobacteraceae bacterium]|nr:hypothetical protein [Caulobacteraceae bacterium]